MGMLLHRHRIERLKTQEAETEVAEALLEAKHKEATDEKTKKPKKSEA